MKQTTQSVLSHARKHPVLIECYKLGSIVVGGLLVAFGLEGFLIPNGFLDGGVVGVAIIASTVVDLPMGVFLAVLNLPFIVLAWRKIGRRSAVRTALGIGTLVVATLVLHHMDPVTDNFTLALGYGGLLLGLGVGLALRQGGALDGTEALASILSVRSRYSVDQLILAMNIVIFAVAAFVLTPEAAMASALLFYVVVAPIIGKVVDGNRGVRKARVTTRRTDEVAGLVSQRIQRPVSISTQRRFHHELGMGEEVSVIEFALSRIEEATITEDILQIDEDATVVFSEISTLHGTMYDDLAPAGQH